jgi:hypothetical protein
MPSLNAVDELHEIRGGAGTDGGWQLRIPAAVRKSDSARSAEDVPRRQMRRSRIGKEHERQLGSTQRPTALFDQ